MIDYKEVVNGEDPTLLDLSFDDQAGFDQTRAILFADRDQDDELQPVNPRAQRFRKLSRRVCLIDREDASEATGYLIGPDLMLTTAHALMGTSGIFADPDKVTVRFDRFIWNERTKTIAMGDSCKLRRIPFTRNPSQPDIVASSIKTSPHCRRRYDDNALDYVLVRLDRPIGLSFLPYSYRLRGWNDCSRGEVPAEGFVYVVQHPLGGLQKFAEGYIPADHVDPEFPHLFRYKTTTLNSSSGAPLFNDRGEVIGMHVGETGKSRQLGVSFQKIFQDLKKEGIRLPPFELTRDVMESIFGSSAITQKRRRGRDWRGDRLFDDADADDYAGGARSTSYSSSRVERKGTG